MVEGLPELYTVYRDVIEDDFVAQKLTSVVVQQTRVEFKLLSSQRFTSTIRLVKVKQPLPRLTSTDETVSVTNN